VFFRLRTGHLFRYFAGLSLKSCQVSDVDHGPLEHLAAAEQHVAQDQERIQKQRGIIADLKSHGHDTGQADALLNTLLNIQALHEQRRDRALRSWLTGHERVQDSIRMIRASIQNCRMSRAIGRPSRRSVRNFDREQAAFDGGECPQARSLP